MGSKLEIPTLALRVTLGGSAGRSVERKLASLAASPASPTRGLVRER